MDVRKNLSTDVNKWSHIPVIFKDLYFSQVSEDLTDKKKSQLMVGVKVSMDGGANH